MKRLLLAILPHAVLVLALMFLVLHEYNPYMIFIGSSVSRIWLLAFCVLAIANSVVCIVRERR